MTNIHRLAQIGALLISLGNELVEIADSLQPPTEDVLYLARAIQGEGAALFGPERDEVGLWIAHTALNRLDCGWWPQYETVTDVVKDAFHGVANVKDPEPWAIDLARQALAREEDIAGGALFMLSGDDLERRGWSSAGAIRSIVYGDKSFHFFKLWPG